MITLLVAASALGQSDNQITAVCPASAAQSTSGLTVTFTLDTDSPPAPPAGIMPTSVTLGTNAGSAVTHSRQYIVPGSGGIDALADPAPTGAQRFYRIGVHLP